MNLVASEVTSLQNLGYGTVSSPSEAVATFTPASPPSSFEFHNLVSDGIAPTAYGSVWIYCM